MAASGPLAYVFWHWPIAGADRSQYERNLDGFHAALAAEDTRASRYSYTVKVPGLPWTPSEGYEDWYVVDDFAALGDLNERAVKARARPFHDAVATMAAGACTRPGVPAGSKTIENSNEPRTERTRLGRWLIEAPVARRRRLLDGTTFGVLRWRAEAA